MSIVAKCGGREWTVEALQKLSADELVKLMDDLDAKRLAIKAQGQAVKDVLTQKLQTQSLVDKLGGLKAKDAEALLALLQDKPDAVKAAIEKARASREEIRVTANAAEVGVQGTGA